jgi:hypothetical protein
MTQKITDSNGEFKGRCFSDQGGKFAFHIHPITKADLPDSGALEVFFQPDVPAPKPSVAPSPTAKPIVKPTVKPSPKVTASATPQLATASAQPSASPITVVPPSPKPPMKSNELPARTQALINLGAFAGGAAIMAGAVALFRKMKK